MRIWTGHTCVRVPTSLSVEPIGMDPLVGMIRPVLSSTGSPSGPGTRPQCPVGSVYRIRALRTNTHRCRSGGSDRLWTIESGEMNRPGTRRRVAVQTVEPTHSASQAPPTAPPQAGLAGEKPGDDCEPFGRGCAPLDKGIPPGCPSPGRGPNVPTRTSTPQQRPLDPAPHQRLLSRQVGACPPRPRRMQTRTSPPTSGTPEAVHDRPHDPQSQPSRPAHNRHYALAVRTARRAFPGAIQVPKYRPSGSHYVSVGSTKP